MKPTKKIARFWREHAAALEAQPDEPEAVLWVTPDGLTSYGPSRREALRRALEDVAAGWLADPEGYDLEVMGSEILAGGAVVLTGEPRFVRLVAGV